MSNVDFNHFYDEGYEKFWTLKLGPIFFSDIYIYIFFFVLNMFKLM